VNDRARELIQILELERHPEGGWYREVFRSPREVRAPLEGAPTRSALTTIYFLLTEGEPTAWHSVASDEIWHFLEGAPAELFTIDPSDSHRRTHRLGMLGGGAAPVGIVPAGHGQMARTLGAFTLVGCTVGPGFDFADFKLLPGDAAAGPHQP
jgi:predicted cupin superfamily sugar epimerase